MDEATRNFIVVNSYSDPNSSRLFVVDAGKTNPRHDDDDAWAQLTKILDKNLPITRELQEKFTKWLPQSGLTTNRKSQKQKLANYNNFADFLPEVKVAIDSSSILRDYLLDEYRISDYAKIKPVITELQLLGAYQKDDQYNLTYEQLIEKLDDARKASVTAASASISAAVDASAPGASAATVAVFPSASVVDEAERITKKLGYSQAEANVLISKIGKITDETVARMFLQQLESEGKIQTFEQLTSAPVAATTLPMGPGSGSASVLSTPPSTPITTPPLTPSVAPPPPAPIVTLDQVKKAINASTNFRSPNAKERARVVVGTIGSDPARLAEALNVINNLPSDTTEKPFKDALDLAFKNAGLAPLLTPPASPASPATAAPSASTPLATVLPPGPGASGSTTGGPGATTGGPGATTGGPGATTGGPGATTGGPGATTGGPGAGLTSTPLAAPPPPAAPIDPDASAYALQNADLDVPTSGQVKRYHKLSILYFFESLENPNWDRKLEMNITASKPSAAERVKIMDAIIKEFGPKIFVFERISQSIEEMNELVQLEFCVLRNLHMGSRGKSITMSESSYDRLKSAIAGPTSVLNRRADPNAPTTASLTAAQPFSTSRPRQVPGSVAKQVQFEKDYDKLQVMKNLRQGQYVPKVKYIPPPVEVTPQNIGILPGNSINTVSEARAMRRAPHTRPSLK